MTLQLDHQPGPQTLSQLPRGQKQTNSRTPWGTGHPAVHDSSDYHPPTRYHLEEAKLQDCSVIKSQESNTSIQTYESSNRPPAGLLAP